MIQKVYNVVSVLALLGLAGWVYYLSKKTTTLEANIIKLTPPVTPVTPPASDRTSVSGAEFWDTLQNKVREMKIDLTFANQQQSI